MKQAQLRILASAPRAEVGKPAELLAQLRNALHRAKNAGRLIPRGDIAKLVQLTPDRRDGTKFTLTGGVKDFKRDEANASLIRDDLAWFHFTITLSAPPEGPVEVLGYDFEIVFPAAHTPPWIRFDLNLPGHHNEDRDLRSHVHPGNGDILLPAPVLTPLELVEFYIDYLRPRDPGHTRHERAGV